MREKRLALSERLAVGQLANRTAFQPLHEICSHRETSANIGAQVKNSGVENV